MAVQAEVIANNFYSRINGAAQKVPKGTKIVVRGIPDALKGKLKLIKEVDDKELIVNDTPLAADLRAQGRGRAADRIMDKVSDEEAKELNRLREAYEELTEDLADKRWSVATLKTKIADATEKVN